MTATTPEPPTTPQPALLPPGWVWTTLGEVRASTSAGILPNQAPDQTYELYSVPSFPSGKPEVLAGREIGSNKQTVEPGMVLVSKINPRINRVWVVGAKGEHPQIASTEWITFAPLGIFVPEFLAYFMRQISFRDYLAANVSGVGGSLTRTNTAVVDRYSFPLPPFPEQQRIVTRIEQLFSKLDAGVAGLKRTQALLKRYRQSLLHAAVTGELSRDWRAANPATETGGELLARILEERRERWAQSGKKGKYKEPQAPDTKELPELPTGWAWASIGQAFEVAVGATPSRARPDFWKGDIPWVSSGEVAFCRIRATRETITPAGYAATSTTLHPPGTVLIGMIGEGRTRGQVAILDIEACNNQNSAAIRVADTPVIPEFIYQYMTSRYEESRRASAGNNQQALNKSRVEVMPLPLPPLPEQAYIVSEVERRLSVLDNLEATVAAELKRAEATRQSILHQAFTGHLVPQDPTDEPASVLLGRLQAEKVKAGVAAIRAGGKRGRKPKGEPLLTPSE